MNDLTLQPELALDAARPWERQVRESARAYAAFRAYRDLGPRRTIREAVLRWSENYNPKRFAAEMAAKLSEIHVPSTFRGWKRRWIWDERVASWDKDCEQRTQAQEQAAELAALQLKMERRAAHDEVIYAALVQIRERLLAITAKDSTLGRVKVISDDPKVGRTIREIDNLKAFHELAEQMRALADSYFGAAVSAEDEQTKTPEVHAAEFIWVPELSDNPQ